MNSICVVPVIAPQAVQQAQLSRLACAATCALHDELVLFPKPGLVSLRDTGSHRDMDASTFIRSLFSLRHYFQDITVAGASHAAFPALVELGIRAEAAMLCATKGINTHRGAIFTLGLLCAAAGGLAQDRQVISPQNIRRQLLARWGDALRARCQHLGVSKGAIAVRQFGLRGAREEAALGFPVLFEVTIPALLRARDQGMSLQYAQLQALFHTMAALDDTNLVSRGGMDGLRWVQAQARSFLAEGGMAHADGEARACAMHAAFVARHLSPGGSADLLAAACWAIRIGETA